MSFPPEAPEKVNLTKQGLKKVQSKKQLAEVKSDEQHLLELQLQDLQNQHTQAEIDRIRIEVKGEEQKQYLQKDYAKWVKWLVCIWLLFIAVVIVSALIAVGGSEYWSRPIKLPSSVLIALLATNVVPLSAVFIKGLFTKK